MKFTQGKSGNPTGRPLKRMPSFANPDLQTKIDKYLNENFKTMLSDLETPAAREKARIYLELLKYSVPRLAARQSEFQVHDLSNGQLKQIAGILQHNALPELEE